MSRTPSDPGWFGEIFALAESALSPWRRIILVPDVTNTGFFHDHLDGCGTYMAEANTSNLTMAVSGSFRTSQTVTGFRG